MAKFLKIIGSSLFQLISLIFVLVYLLGVLNINFSDRNNYCDMTYMYEYPQFVKISVPENDLYPQYALYAYSEGRLTEKARKMWFDGVPVLYLPGNSGSHMQGRSLASVALRMGLSNQYVNEYHFDYFTISFNEDLSGVYGGVLQTETDFAAACITKILSLYKRNKYAKAVPTSVILIGHSMGGLIAKRLLAYPDTIATANIAITLAAPLEAPVINFDLAINNYYHQLNRDWETYIRNDEEIRNKKLLLSFGNGARDVLMPAGLTMSNDSDVGALTTSVPGVWVSPDHVSIVWCKQLVLKITKFLFSIVDPVTEQVVTDKDVLMDKARQYFQANRSMTLNPNIRKSNVTMSADAFWYEDNRRNYQISRPEIDKTTYLMIRLISFPQNRFVAIESVNVDDKDWIFGCNAMYTHGPSRYCKQGTSLSELSRWTGAAKTFGKRKLATIHLHDLMTNYPEWSHVVVKVSPTRKSIVLNIDINDHASRQITADLPSGLSLAKTILKEETERNSVYYEILLPGFNYVYQAYLLYVEPIGNCLASQHHASAELHVPWAENNEVSHYFTQVKQTPMKLRLFNSNPNATAGQEVYEHAKITLLLDPKCTYSISISTSWYYGLAQLVRNYSLVLLPYVAAIILLATRCNILHFNEKGTCLSIHGALMSEGVKPYYALVFSRLGTMFLTSIPFLLFLFENASWYNTELRYFTRSLLVLPAYLTALGVVNVAAAVVLGVMVFSSQLAHRLLFRIVWRGGTNVAEKVASGLQKVPMIVSAGLVFAVPLSCGAAALAAGAAFYAFMLSKMYEEYLEDYVYKLMAKLAAKMCRIFKSKKTEGNLKESEVKDQDIKAIENETNDDKQITSVDDKTFDKISEVGSFEKDQSSKEIDSNEETKAILPPDDNKETGKRNKRKRKVKTDEEVDDELNSLNFHMMMFFLWVIVTIVNLPALLTWARNFKYSMVLKPDTSYHTGMVMAACSTCIWQMEGPRRNLRHYETISSFIFTMSVFILALGPYTLYIVNYGVTLIFVMITLQQLFDKEVVSETHCDEGDGTNKEECTEKSEENEPSCSKDSEKQNDKESPNNKDTQNEKEGSQKEKEESQKENDESEKKSEDSKAHSSADVTNDCDVCNENSIYRMFKNLREKFSFTEEL